MNKKLSLLAVSVAMVLAGCGSDSSDGSTATPVSGKFIDNAVEGMYYTTTSGKSGITDSDGEYQAMSGDTITFYIGGENGLKVGAGSTRDILTPFEAAGKYERAVNLAILLQSLDKKFGSQTDNVLTIPDELREPSADTRKAMQVLSLDDHARVVEFLKTAFNFTDSEIISELDAVKHMQESFGNLERGGEGSNPFIQMGKYVRQIHLTQNSENHRASDKKSVYVHADTLMEKELYDRTRGMTALTIKMADADHLVEMKGSVDYSISGDNAGSRLACMSKDGIWNNDNTCSVDTSDIIEKFQLEDGYEYQLRDMSKATLADKIPENRDVFMPFSADTIAQLNHYTADNLRNDLTQEESDNGVEPKWKRETMSGSYDPITGVYTQIMKQTDLSGCDVDGKNCIAERSSEKVFYTYLVDQPSEDRYVDFTGQWETHAFCDNGEVAVMTTTFDGVGQTTSGQECKGSPSQPGNVEDAGKLYAYESYSDMWWFGQTARESKATLTELNTLVRYCDQDEYVMGQQCNNIYYIKWEYQPAGKNWDEGLLTRSKMKINSGVVSVEDFSIMQKVK